MTEFVQQAAVAGLSKEQAESFTRMFVGIVMHFGLICYIHVVAFLIVPLVMCAVPSWRAGAVKYAAAARDAVEYRSMGAFLVHLVFVAHGMYSILSPPGNNLFVIVQYTINLLQMCASMIGFPLALAAFAAHFVLDYIADSGAA